MLVHRLRHRPSITPALDQHIVLHVINPRGPPDQIRLFSIDFITLDKQHLVMDIRKYYRQTRDVHQMLV